MKDYHLIWLEAHPDRTEDWQTPNEDDLMARNEKTGARIARIAAKVLARTNVDPSLSFWVPERGSLGMGLLLSWSDIRALARLCARSGAPHERARKKLRGPTKPPTGRTHNT